jgi:hypothetical protein
MIFKGSFGFIIGRKKRFMKVDDNANLLWRILVREIYVIMKHFGLSKVFVQEAFEKIKVIKGGEALKPSIIEKCKIFSDFEEPEYILKYCQCSFINLLEAGNIMIDSVEQICDDEYCFVLDFNKWEVRFSKKGLLIETAKIEEIMVFEEMPTKTYTEIVSEMTDKFILYNDSVNKVNSELEKLNNLKTFANSQSAANIEDKLDKMIDDMKWELKELNISRRVFYNRLKALDLIEE